ncbi:hypothetical protein N566_22180 [Streptomycetaceae bacterium MP113-05]|nr:hypothetical protein N566_22180 [Streptomycetaceae bacterium MP113-05]
MMAAAAVMGRAVLWRPAATAPSLSPVARQFSCIPYTAYQEYFVVHGQAEEDREGEQGQQQAAEDEDQEQQRDGQHQTDDQGQIVGGVVAHVDELGGDATDREHGGRAVESIGPDAVAEVLDEVGGLRAVGADRQCRAQQGAPAVVADEHAGCTAGGLRSSVLLRCLLLGSSGGQ